ncbi:Flavorubredoxin [Halanaerobium congolense]|jgi:flavorubredoxin|uniref:Flavorubredoxin n=1 Tax=Halanaerobium congolense TaxID=54121 RepID=A0A1G8I9S5_9FIRM|nr:FprA family A-type flavoprotein [Halanaerobium congolense]PXV67259.1 flavorubredoxin [Halanaerobium congolense]TDS34642.1 flavorubredoxin [Halanaerobium congolense]SDI15607.1 Flavorubredoxin [Halanaerobium congolense]SES74575.1 Flavorubredoxin [Halanaerobium congolense]
MLRKIKDDIYSVGVIDWHRKLFDELIPLPDGTSYNSYFIQGQEKNAIIDTVEPDFDQEFLDNLEQAGVEKVDYIISNHAEQDHSGTIPVLLEKYPEAEVLCSAKAKSMLLDLLELKEDQIRVVEDGETLDLGGKTLEFIDTPWVHWPETMSTYLQEENILFPCDFFGSHLATSDLYVEDEAEVFKAAKRYYAEIMMPFRKIIKKNLAKLEDYEIDMIAPSHGPIYDNPEMILDAYHDWVSDEVKPQVIVPYVSMHGSTDDLVNYFIDSLIDEGIKVKPFNLTDVDLGDLAISLVDASTVVFGSPTVLTGPHPAAVYAAYLANVLKPKTRYASIIGSYGWAGRMTDKLLDLMPNLKVELYDPVVAKGHGADEDYQEIDRLVAEIKTDLENL